jgi:hypothetical protein
MDELAKDPQVHNFVVLVLISMGAAVFHVFASKLSDMIFRKTDESESGFQRLMDMEKTQNEFLIRDIEEGRLSREKVAQAIECMKASVDRMQVTNENVARMIEPIRDIRDQGHDNAKSLEMLALSMERFTEKQKEPRAT